MPDVSVVMPVMNGVAHLRSAIESVLAQRGPSLELVIVDDGSTDGSLELAERVVDPRVVIVRNARRAGLASALNVGLRRAAGEFIARLDADDVAHPARLDRQVGFFRRHPEIALIGSQARLINESGRPVGTVSRCCDDTTIRWYNLLDNPFIHSSVMFRRREVLDDLGGYDESLSLCEDWALWGRVMTRHAVCNLDAPLVDYRFSLGSITGAIESSASHPRRPQFREIATCLMGRHVTQTLGAGAASNDEIELLSGFLLGVNADTLDSFLALFERLLAAFSAKHAGTAESADFARTLARQFDAIAFRVTPSSRRAALRAYAAALRHGPLVARFLPWSRAAVSTLLGRGWRDRLRQLRDRSGMAWTA